MQSTIYQERVGGQTKYEDEYKDEILYSLDSPGQYKTWHCSYMLHKLSSIFYQARGDEKLLPTALQILYNTN